MSERTTRLLAVVALSVAMAALLIAVLALRRADDRTQEVERLRDVLERAASAPPTGGGRPPLALDPGHD